LSSLCEQAVQHRRAVITATATHVEPCRRPTAKISLWSTAQCAASNRPLPGAETALILYHRYFFGVTRPASDEKPVFARFSGGRATQKAQRINVLNP